MNRWLPYAVLLAVVVALTQLPPTNDAAWQLWIGRQLAAGQILYRDIIEINPPLWFWLAVPIIMLASLLNLSGFAVLVGLLGLLAAVSIAMVQRLRPRPWWISLSLVFAFFLTSISATGQREQFTLIAVTPYVFLAAARADGRPIPSWFAIATGLFAAVGIALKHYFLLLPLALELWLLWKRRGPIRPELIAVVAAGASYLVAILVLARDYFASVVPLVREAYGAYDDPLVIILRTETVAIVAIVLLGLVLVRGRSNTLQAIAVASAALLLAYIVQQKGYRYQGLPALGLASLAAMIGISELRFNNVREKVAAAIVTFALAATLWTSISNASRVSHGTARMLCKLPPESTVLVLTTVGDVAWPAIEVCDLRWASRYMDLWMLPAITGDPHRHSRLAADTREAIVQDVARHRPDLIVIARRERGGDSLAFVMSDPAFRSQLASYERNPSEGAFTIFRKKTP